MKKLLFMLLFTKFAVAQAVNFYPSPQPHQCFFENGVPLAGGKIFTYVAGTTTPLSTFTDSGGVSMNQNPIILDSQGCANIWLGLQGYKYIVQDANGVQQWTTDNLVPTRLDVVITDPTAAAVQYLVGPLTLGVNGSNGQYLLQAGAGQFNGPISSSSNIVPSNTPSGGTLGTSLTPWSSVFIGSASINNIQLTGTATTSRTATLPDNTGTIAELNLAQTWTAVQTFPTSDVAIGTSPNVVALAAAPSAPRTATFSDASGTVLVTGNGTNPLQTASAAGCATGASVGAACTTTVTWTTSFADTNYRAVCNGDVITSGVPVGGGLTAKANGSVTFQTVATTAAAAQYTNVECIAVHN